MIDCECGTRSALVPDLFRCCCCDLRLPWLVCVGASDWLWLHISMLRWHCMPHRMRPSLRVSIADYVSSDINIIRPRSGEKSPKSQTNYQNHPSQRPGIFGRIEHTKSMFPSEKVQGISRVARMRPSLRVSIVDSMFPCQKIIHPKPCTRDRNINK